jgi:hypothetical protein
MLHGIEDMSNVKRRCARCGHSFWAHTPVGSGCHAHEFVRYGPDEEPVSIMERCKCKEFVKKRWSG